MILTPPQEAALLAALVHGHPTMADLYQLQNLQAELIRRDHVRQHFDAIDAQTPETAG